MGLTYIYRWVMDNKKFEKAAQLREEMADLSDLKDQLTVSDKNCITKMEFTVASSSKVQGGLVIQVPPNIIEDILPAIHKAIESKVKEKEKEFKAL